jgi:hypothetical protein
VQPFEEFERELSISLPFGSQRTEAFAEAEPFVVVDPRLAPFSLRDATVSCTQGLDFDSKWSCIPVQASHKVCGHTGTISFASPSYEIREGGRNITITIRRSGGGYGECAVEYTLSHITTDDSDVTAVAAYTTSQTLVFAPGVISLSFFVVIHQDTHYDPDERFSISLQNPTNGAALGPQRVTIVTILDDDQHETSPNHTVASGAALSNAQVNLEASITIQAKTPEGIARTAGGDLFSVEMWDHDAPADETATSQYAAANFGVKLESAADMSGHARVSSHMKIGSVTDNADGTYTGKFTPAREGHFSLAVRHLAQFGLYGQYWDNVWLMGEPVISRVDAVLNFTWGEGALTPSGTDFTSARWWGKLRAPATGLFTFHILADDHTRLWLDRELLIDTWDCDPNPCKEASATFQMTEDSFHDIRVEYREIRGRAALRLMWELPGDASSLKVIPARYLYVARHIAGSPFRNLKVRPAPTSPTTTIVSGEGSFYAVAGQMAKFCIHPRDVHNNPVGDYSQNDQFNIMATLLEGGSFTNGGGQGTKTVLGTHTYDASEQERQLSEGTYYTYARSSGVCHEAVLNPTISGEYNLEVTLLSDTLTAASQYTSSGTWKHIFGSPYRLTVVSSPTHARTCEVGTLQSGRYQQGGGLSSGTAGIASTFTIRARDANDNLRGVGGDSFSVSVFNSVAQFVVQGVVEDNNDGTYKVTYTPLKSRAVSIHVLLNGNHVGKSPYSATIADGSIAAVYAANAPKHIAPATSTVVSGDRTKFAVANVVSQFTIEARDAWGNTLHQGGMTSTSGSAITIKLNHMDAYPPDNENAADPNEVTGSVTTDHGNGFYDVQYTATVSGNNKLSVLISGAHIAGSPFTVEIADGAVSGGTSLATGTGLTFAISAKAAFFTVQAKDATHNDKSMDGDTFSVQLTGPSTITGNCNKYIAKGKYQCTYTAAKSGNYNLIVKDQNNVAIVGSPFSTLVDPAEPDGPLTLPTGTGLSTGVAGVQSPLYIQMRDAQNNDLTANDQAHLLMVELIGVGTHPQEDHLVPPASFNATIVDTKTQGKYTAHYTPTQSGLFDCHISLYVGGGLSATFFTGSQLLSPHIRLTRTDAQIDFDWGVGSPKVGIVPSEQFSARWEGWLRVDVTEPVTFTVITSGSVRLWVTGKLLVDQWPASRVGAKAASVSDFEGVIDLKAGEYAHLKMEYLHGDLEDGTVGAASTGDAMVKLEYNSPSLAAAAGALLSDSAGTAELSAVEAHRVGRVTVPASRLFHRRPIMQSPYAVKVFPAPSHAATSIAQGLGIEYATAGIQSRFTIQAKDAWGNKKISADGDFFNVVATKVPIQRPFKQFKGSATYIGMGAYEVVYTPATSGIYQLIVSLNNGGASHDWGHRAVMKSLEGSQIKGSPFRVEVADGAARGSTSSAIGSGTGGRLDYGSFNGLYNATNGILAYFTVQARDGDGNDKTVPGDAIAATLTSAGKPSVTSLVRYVGSGQYECKYNATVAGTYSMAVTVVGEHIQGSPFAVTVNPSAAHGPTSTAVGPGVATATVGTSTSFTITARDYFGGNWVRGIEQGYTTASKLWKGGDKWIVRLSGPVKPYLHVPVVDRGDGTYTVTFKAPTPGRYAITVGLADSILTAPENNPGQPSGTWADGGQGLRAFYYNNRYLRGEPVHTQIHKTVDLNWSEGNLTEHGRDHISVRMRGLLRTYKHELGSPLIYKFLVKADDGARLFVNDILIIDQFGAHNSTHAYPAGGVSELTGSIELPSDVLVNIVLDFRELSNAASLQLTWLPPGGAINPVDEGGDSRTFADSAEGRNRGPERSPSVILSSHLYPRWQHIRGSPFTMIASQGNISTSSAYVDTNDDPRMPYVDVTETLKTVSTDNS